MCIKVSPELITAIATTLTAIFVFYEVIWKKRPNIKIETVTNEVLSGMGPLSKGAGGYKGYICVIVRNKSSIPLKCTGQLVTDKVNNPLFDWHKYQLTRPEPNAGAEPFRFFEISADGSKYLFGQVDSLIDQVTIKIWAGKREWSKPFSLKEIAKERV